ncbi:PQQ-dependent sugar dehydrogenase [Glycomyces harbinensis]|uniref:Glucose/arabinose dehydrogenase, beta-propeller fold n=1 Tax=Glycomyces harbinensis TaxID=58114 RepID=A0A1G7D2B5_9ACTN|nr:PQQ-dependent sugar dehydrogenase [Glycomyces harbinensis]SDE45633.1 Glucose/arabinose dehydrogenase, beta-propeller fold [Glycomyces harbinensis]
MSGESLRRFAAALVLAPLLLVAPGAAEAEPPAEFERLLVVGGLEEPTSFRFTPAGDVLVAEKNGAIRLVEDGALHGHPLIELGTAGSDERGLLGLEIDPDFASNGYVYAGYTAADNLDRLSRFTMTGHQIDPASELVLIQSQQDANVFHHSGSVGFGADGKLYWTLGMNTNSQNPMNLGNVHGKMHRVNADGSIPADNPFVDTPGAEPSVWAYGLRNSFRWDVVPSGPNAGKILAGDVGGSEFEELNLIERGANYGWPEVEGECGDCPYAQPVWTYPHTDPPASAGSVSAVEVYEGGLLGEAYEGAVFVADYTLGFVKYLEMDESFETVVSVHDFDTGAGTPVELQTGPDGALYQLNIYPGELYRIAPSGGNRTPVAEAGATPDSGFAPLEVQFSSEGSRDADGDALSYAWDFGDGGSSTEADPVHVYTGNGVYQAVLTVDDGEKSAEAVVEVQVGNSRPEAVIESPGEGLTYDAGDVVGFSGSGSDPEDGALGAAAMSWTVQFHHADHVHPFFGPETGSAAGEIEIPRAPHGADNTFYRISLTVTDAGGLTDTAFVDVHPNTVEVSLSADPPGLAFTLDGRPYTGTAVKRMVVGGEYVLDAASPQHAGAERYAFDSWSSGADRHHVFTVPDEDTAVTAHFTELAFPPAPWESTDVGERTQLGLSSYDDGKFTVTGAGWDVWGGTDEFHFVHQPLAGDGQITARLTSQDDTHPWAKAGVMVKESTEEGAKYASIAVTPENGAHFQADFGTDGGGFDYEEGAAWLRLTREGDVFTAELSADGEDWTVIGSATVPMSADAQIGLFATSHDNTRFSTAVFDSVEVDAGDPSAGWECQDVGDPALPGNASFDPDGSIAVTGGGDDVWGGADQFHYCHQELAGDGEIIARVVAQGVSDEWAKAGLMVKTAPEAGADYVAAMTTPEHGVRLQTGFDTDTAGPEAGAPVWLRLVREGTTVTAFHSDDGTGWEPFASARLEGAATVGLFVTSHDGGEWSTAVFDSVTVRDTAPAVPEPWTCEDVGDPAIPGDAVFDAEGTVTMIGAGDDVWGDADQFRFCHQELAGDGQITTRVVFQEDTDDWAKAGVMVKTGTEAGAAYAALMLTPGHGVHLQSGFDTDVDGPDTGAPVWLRLSRVGEVVTAAWSADGEAWADIGSADLAGGAVVGLFATSHDGSESGTAVFDSVTVA